MMMTMWRLMNLMAEEEEDSYDTDELGRENTERKDGDTDVTNSDNAEAVDMKDADSDDEGTEGPMRMVMMVI